MDWIAFAVGLAFCAYAAFVLVMRLRKKDHLFRKLGVMKERFGPRAGSIVHYVGYAAIPFLVGLFFAVAGLLGIDVFRLLAG